MSFYSFDNIVVWSILVLGFVCYQLLCYYTIRSYFGDYQLKQASWLNSAEIFIGALPLLGLLGTISGLLDTFHAMSLGQSLDQASTLSQGIADALWTNTTWFSHGNSCLVVAGTPKTPHCQTRNCPCVLIYNKD